MMTWNIYKANGHYIGQAQAQNAESAFCQYMPIFVGRASIPSDEIAVIEIGPSVCEITYAGEVFVIRAVT